VGETENPYVVEEKESAPSMLQVGRQFLILSLLIAVLLFQVMFSTRTIWGQVWERNGQIAFSNKDYDGARRYYRFAAGLNPGNSRALYELGVASRNLNDFELAFQAQQFAVLQSPFYAPSLVELAELHNLQGNWEQAATYIDRAEKVTPSFWKIYYARGFGASTRGDLEEAALALEKSVSVAARPNMVVHALLAKTYFDMKEWGKALKAIDDSIQMNKNIPQYHVLRGEILLELNRKPAAKKAWEWAAYLYSVPPFNQGAANRAERNALSARMIEVGQ
jgi:tetratricopeptide (TPR) repeat protein